MDELGPQGPQTNAIVLIVSPRFRRGSDSPLVFGGGLHSTNRTGSSLRIYLLHARPGPTRTVPKLPAVRWASLRGIWPGKLPMGCRAAALACHLQAEVRMTTDIADGRAAARDWIKRDLQAARQDVKHLGLNGAAEWQMVRIEQARKSEDHAWNSVTLNDMRLALAELGV